MTATCTGAPSRCRSRWSEEPRRRSSPSAEPPRRRNGQGGVTSTRSSCIGPESYRAGRRDAALRSRVLRAENVNCGIEGGVRDAAARPQLTVAGSRPPAPVASPGAPGARRRGTSWTRRSRRSRHASSSAAATAGCGAARPRPRSPRLRRSRSPQGRPPGLPAAAPCGWGREPARAPPGRAGRRRPHPRSRCLALCSLSPQHDGPRGRVQRARFSGGVPKTWSQ